MTTSATSHKGKQGAASAAPALSHAAALRALQAVGQDHLLRFYDTLSPDQQRGLLAQVAALDLPRIPSLIDNFVKSRPKAEVVGAVQPAPYYPLRTDTRHKPWNRDDYKAKGAELVRAGKVAAFTVAGGQGSRLGFEGPKGCYPAGAVTAKPLFACLADWILAAQERFAPAPGARASIPWYIMTSPGNHDATVAFFKQHDHFGLNHADVMFFPQGVMPALDINTGKILLESPASLALAPDGHGGSLKALRASGALADMKARGVELISYTQIDNPLVRVIDPVFLGLHAFAPDSSNEMSSKMVVKAHAAEKVGVLCKIGDRVGVIEYSDLPDDLAKKKSTDGGGLAFNAGNVAIHVISVAFLERLTAGNGFALPFHRAEKKVPCIDLKTGKPIAPEKPNAVKLETFVFDALPLCKNSLVLEADRTDEFAPIKNASGPDSPDSCRLIQSQRAARWLEDHGVRVPRQSDGNPACVLELSPRTAMYPEDLKGFKPSKPLAAGTSVAL